MNALHFPALYPDRQAFSALAASGNVVPVYATIIADTETPVSVFRRFDDGQSAFLLESVEGGEKWASHSFIGLNPFLTLSAQGSRVTITRDGMARQVEGDPIELLRGLMGEFEAVEVPGLPRFAGGAVGYFGYDTVRFVERLPEVAAPGIGIPDARWMFPSDLLVFDNLSHELKLVHLVRLEEGTDPARAYDEAATAIARLVDCLNEPVKPTERKLDDAPIALRGDFTQEQFEAAVEGVKEHIRAGDVFQLVLSQRFQAESSASAFDIYRALRVINPSPYLYFLRFPEAAVVGSSPELLFRVAGRTLTVRPLAGTRPRGATPEQDRAHEESLKVDPKEIAEHVMLIDLGRNDVGRVSVLGSVRVVDRMVVERYSHVMHLVSSVTGQLLESLDSFDALRATFPAGTLSGAPKVRAMELIESFEPVRRGLYGGAVGYFSFNGDADLAIAIRTLVATGQTITFQTGAGLVYDSNPRTEYEETLHKAGAVRRAIEMAHRGLNALN